MNRLNNKGQSLVMFIIIIPIVCLVFTLVYDVGIAIYEKNNLCNTSYIVIDYGLDNIDNVETSDLIELIQMNSDDLSYISVDIEEYLIKVTLSKEIKGIMGKIFGFNLMEVNTYYEGTVVNDEKRIERVV